MSKSKLHTSYKLLLVFFILFLLILTLNTLGFYGIAKALFYISIIVFIWGWVNSMFIVIEGNKRAFKRLKNKETVLSDDLTDD